MGDMTFKDYHTKSMAAKDVDPAIICLKYIADRFELNRSQRHWIAYLYGTNYCGPTTFLMYNEFPDYEMVDVRRLQNWWENNKHRLIFQSDRLRVKTGNNFVPSFISYKNLCKSSQEHYFSSVKSISDGYKKITAIKHFGRFSYFNYCDVLSALTGFPFVPRSLNMAEAESCRKGLCYAINKESWVNEKLTNKRALHLHNVFLKYLKELKCNAFQLETTLCAYHKYKKGQRYVGYYIDRMKREIEKMEQENHGVDWSVLWQFRAETFSKEYLIELQ